MRISRCIPKATNTHSDYVIITAFPLQQWLKERVSLLRYTVLPVLLVIWRCFGGIFVGFFTFILTSH